MEFNNNTVQNMQPQGQPQVQPVPQPNNVQQMPGQVQMSQMERLRQQMMQQNGQPQQTNPTVMQQGGSYNPAGQQPIPVQQPVTSQQHVQQQVQQPTPMQQQQQVGQPANDSVNSDGDKEKAKVSHKFILIGFGLFVAVIIIMLVLSQLNKADNPTQGQDPSSSGPVDEFGNPVGDGTGGDLIFIEPNESVVGYEFDQIENLRAAGYTGTEIEENEANGVPYEDLIKQAEDARQAWIDEAVAPLYDTASDEYKNSVRNTWLGLPQRTDVDDFQQVGSYYEETKNFDYEKVEPRGYQLYVKIYLDDTNHDNYFFLSVEPSEYLKLKESGNVVVTYRYTVPVVWNEEQQAFVENIDQIFIVDASLTIFD